MNSITLSRTVRSTKFSAIAEGGAYAAAEGDNNNVYIKAKTNTYNLPTLLGKNRTGRKVGAAVRLSDGQVVFHFLDKNVVPASLTGTARA